MYVRQYDQFYIVPCKNTRRLPYDVECVVGLEWKAYEDIEEKRFIMRQ